MNTLKTPPSDRKASRKARRRARRLRLDREEKRQHEREMARPPPPGCENNGAEFGAAVERLLSKVATAHEECNENYGLAIKWRYALGPRGRRREFANATWIDRVWRDGCWDLEGDSCIERWLKGN